MEKVRTAGGGGDKVGGDGDGSRHRTQQEEEKEQGQEAIRLSLVKRKKDFKHMERIGGGRWVNVLQGLELHEGVFSAAEQQRIVDCVLDFQDRGRSGLLRERTYSEPKKWMRGKGRVTIQFGCCYNYAKDNNGNLPGIMRDEEVDPMPPILKTMIKRMVAWHVLPPTCVPNSCIINIYDEDDCIPPHIDHHDFVRPFCTVSFLSQCNILFGTHIKVVSPGVFAAPTSIPLPVGSVLVLNGNGADVAKHCVPAVPTKRISITFRKMEDRKLPYRFIPDPELQNLRPLRYPPMPAPVNELVSSRAQPRPASTPLAQAQPASTPPPRAEPREEQSSEGKKWTRDSPFSSEDFPPLGSLSSAGKSQQNKPHRPARR
ncbi:RNA demethylase ALKBH5-like [Ananas comosus]|uniref:RNA demethylase ALKBH5-like n=1 Tax=Ananas comosus TaxID=4615 RepID=A0A6P5G4L3_ANACO|nr:RNA demethylase ALKBH5-like [Ananas comosus]